MLKKNVSGQFLFFDAVSVLSGFPIEGFSGAITGTRWTDTGNQTVLSGNIVEVSGGMYRANLHDFDTNGDYIGYLFTASGMVPRSFTIMTIGGISGQLNVAPVAVLSGNLSGQLVNVLSGNVVSVLSGELIATLASGTTYLGSGHAVLVYSGALSGQQVTLTSGVSYPASGVFAAGTATVASGSLFLASGHFLHGSGTFFLGSGHAAFVYSGSLSGQQVTLVSGQSYPASGITVAGTASGAVYLASGHFLFGSGRYFLASGHFLQASGHFHLGSGHQIRVFSGQLSGHQVDLLSGRSYTASGVIVAVPIASLSGTTVEVPIASISGVVANSGLFVSVPIFSISGVIPNVLSGQARIASGSFVVGTFSLGSGALSGQQVTLVSGQSFIASGHNTVVPIASISGTNAIVPIATISGTNVVATLLSGQSVLVNSGQLSGHQVDLLSGRSYTASGIFGQATATVASGGVYLASGHNLFYSGQLYPNSGLSVLILSGRLSGQQVTLTSGQSYPASGVNVVGAFTLASGAMSGQQVTLVSGQSYTASGIFAVATATVGSGLVFLASGHNLFYSGQLYPNSGLSVRILSGQLSGHQVTLTSGQSYIASGINVVGAFTLASGAMSGQQVTLVSGQSFVASGINVVGAFTLASGAMSGQQVTLVSGQSYPASGIFAAPTTSGQVYLASGTEVLVLSGQLSGQQVTARTVSDKSGYTAGLVSGLNYIGSGHHAVVLPETLSGVIVNSGLFVSVPIASISGVNANATATVTSGAIFLASGSQVLLHSGGLDTVTVEASMNARQALAIAAAAAAGKFAGAGTTSVQIDGANVPGTARISATVDASGNRTGVTLILPG